MSIKSVLQSLGRAMPDFPLVRAVPNRTVLPLHRRLKLGGGVVDVLGSRMLLDPDECVDAGLWFQPHVYDRRERDFVRRHIKSDGVFLDVGANIGVWSLYLARFFPNARIIAIEANPNTASILEQNIELNGYRNIAVARSGVGDRNTTLSLRLNLSGNRGGDSFVVEGRDDGIEVPVRRFSDLLADYSVEQIDFMKIDIEGMEQPVINDLFESCSPSVWPKIICAEVIHSPELLNQLKRRGYRVAVVARENCVFVLDS